MERPSDYWQSLDALRPNSDEFERINRLLVSADFEFLEERALHVRKRHQLHLPPDVDCRVNLTHLTSGFNNLVLELAFSDDVYWVVRIPFQALDDGDRTWMISEMAI